MIERVFLSVPLVAVPNSESIRNLYRELAEICREKGFEVYEPYEYSDPQRHQFIPAVDVYQMNLRNVTSSSLLIAYVGIVSAGVAMEIAFATNNDIPVIILFEEAQRIALSRMILGCRAYEITAQDSSSLPKVFNKQFDDILLAIRSAHESPSDADFVRQNEFFEKKRGEAGKTYDQIAHEAGLTRGYVHRIINGRIRKPGRNQLIRLCVWGLGLTCEESNEVLRAYGHEQL